MNPCYPLSRLTFAVMFCLAGAAASAAPSAPPPQIVPLPMEMTCGLGSFEITDRTAILIPQDCPQAKLAAEALNQHLAGASLHLRLKVRSAASVRHAIHLQILPDPNPKLGEEGYCLEISPQGVVISANRPAGLFYSIQTLVQMLRPEVGAAKPSLNPRLLLPVVSIVDAPRFAWRGLLLDCSRHFFTAEEVKAYIECMARYKFNILHWHLTDDQGWRIQIKSRPQLTAVGAWRVPREGPWWSYDPPQPGEPATYGGFYSQDQIRAIVAYARDRFVTVVPEIETPGHSMATIAACPELSCGGGPFQVNPGSKFYGTIENSLCAGNEATFTFLDQVFGEVALLFPSPYIHVGGDEAFHGFWAKCPKCKQRMASENLKSLAELQSYFIKRVEKIVESKGKRLIGWDEILDGGLAPNATVMSWRGTAGGEAAAKMGHQLVLAPSPQYYLDLYQGDPVLESNTYSMARLRDVYRFEPLRASVAPRLVLGIQGNLWTESVPNIRQAQYMTWPRALAIAESAWTPAANKNWDDFFLRAEAQMRRLAIAGVNCARSAYDPIVTPRKDSDGFLVLELSSEIAGVTLHYTFAAANPDETYPAYQSPLRIPRNAAEIRVVAVRGGKPIGRTLNISIQELVKRLGEPCKLHS